MRFKATSLTDRNALLYLGSMKENLQRKILVGLLPVVILVPLAIAYGDLTDSPPAGRPLLIAAVLLASWFGGLPGGIVASAVVYVVFVFYTIVPVNDPHLHSNEIWFLISFTFLVALINAFNFWRRSVEIELIRTRNALDTAVQEVDSALQRQTAAMTSELAVRTRLESVISGVPGVVWEAWGKPDTGSQRIDFVSPYVETMLGYTVDEWIATPNFWLQLVHPEDRERAAAEATATFESGGSGRNEFRWVAKNGRIVWVRAFSNVILDSEGRPAGMRGITLDDTERKRAETALDVVSQASLVLNASLDYDETLENLGPLLVPGMCDWYTVHLQEDSEVRLVALSHRDTAKVEWAKSLAERYRDGPLAMRGYRQVMRSGQSQLMPRIPQTIFTEAGLDADRLEFVRQVGFHSYICVPIVSREAVIGAITLISAESGRTYDEEDLQLAEEIGRRAGLALENARLYRESELSRRQLEESNRAKDEFLGIVSHELRTPITTIYGSARLLNRRLSSLDDDARRQLTEGIEEESEKMARLIENLLLLARVDLGAHIEKQPSFVPRHVDKVLAALRRQSPNREYVVRLDPEATLLICEPTYLEQMLTNLLGNADKYSPPGEPVELVVTNAPGEMQFRVLDNGPGVLPEELPLLFDSFYRSARTARRAPGKGLGLAVCKRLVEAQGGQIWAQLRPGGGLEVGFVLPLTEEAAEPCDTETSDQPKTTSS